MTALNDTYISSPWKLIKLCKRSASKNGHGEVINRDKHYRFQMYLSAELECRLNSEHALLKKCTCTSAPTLDPCLLWPVISKGLSSNFYVVFKMIHNVTKSRIKKSEIFYSKAQRYRFGKGVVTKHRSRTWNNNVNWWMMRTPSIPRSCEAVFNTETVR